MVHRVTKDNDDEHHDHPARHHAGQALTADASVPEWTPPSWDEIVREHTPRVYRLAYRLTGNVHDAEDLTHDVFIRVFRSLGTYTPGTFEGWLHRITTNVFLDKMRRKRGSVSTRSPTRRLRA